MATRTSELAALLGYASERLGSSWSVAGKNRLKGRVGPEAEGIILFLAAGLEIFTVSVEVGPRFPEVERIVSKAGRAAGLPEAHFRTASQFPTLFERISQLSNLRDYVSMHEHEAIAAALMEKAVPFIERCSSIVSAAEYGFTRPLAFGHHSMRVPVLLAKSGRLDDAESYMRSAMSGPNSDFYARYAESLRPLIF